MSSPAARSSAPPAPASPIRSVSNAPALAYRRHFHGIEAPRVDGAAFRPGWRVCIKLDSLLEQGRLDREQYDAAHWLRRLLEVIAPSRVQSWEIRVDTSRAGNDGGAGRRIDAAARVREAAEAIGQLRVKIIETVTVRDCSWAELGKLMQCSDKTATQRCVEAIAALADWRAGRTVAPEPPPVRFKNQPGAW
jgi:hypothetical protein